MLRIHAHPDGAACGDSKGFGVPFGLRCHNRTDARDRLEGALRGLKHISDCLQSHVAESLHADAFMTGVQLLDVHLL